MPGAAERRLGGVVVAGAGGGAPLPNPRVRLSAGDGLAGIVLAGASVGGLGSCESSAGAADGLNLIAGTPLTADALLGVAVTTPGAVAGSRIGNVARGWLVALIGAGTLLAGLLLGAASTMRIGVSADVVVPLVLNEGAADSLRGFAAMSVRIVLPSKGRELPAATSITGTVVAEIVGVAAGGV
jgi:hypothetical protein